MRMSFRMSYWDLPLHRDVDFVMEFHPGTSSISMILHRMAPVELHELKVQLQELLDKGFEHFYDSS